MALSKQQILAADDLVIREVVVPEWGGTVHVRSMPNPAGDYFEATLVDRNDGNTLERVRGMKALLLALTLCDEQGVLLFASMDDGGRVTVDETGMQALDGKSRAALDRCFRVSQEINHLTGDEVDELAKN